MPIFTQETFRMPSGPRGWLIALAVLSLVAGCRSGDLDSPPVAGETLSFYEERLLNAIERKQALEAYAEQYSGSDWPEIQRRFRDLAGEFEAIIADNPDQIEARLIYGKFLDFFGDEDGAREQWVEVLDRDRTVAVAHQQLGTYFAEKGEFDRALAYYLTAIEHDPDVAVYHFGLGELLHSYRKGFLEEVGIPVETFETQLLDAFREAARLDPANFVYQFRYGEAFYNVTQPDWEQALSHWNELGNRPDLSHRQTGAIHLHQARVLGEMERYDEARALAQSVDEPGLTSSRDALIEAIDEAASGGGEEAPSESEKG